MQRCLPDNSTADALIAAHDGDVALLYIYLCRRGGDDMEQAARELCRTMGEISAAWEKLQRMGLLPVGEAAAPLGQRSCRNMRRRTCCAAPKRMRAFTP